jgi:serine/threonine protein kinase
LELQPQQKLGGYTVLRKLAEGGMAEIYLAQRDGALGFQKVCVLKRVKARFRTDEKFRAMFELEAKMAANLDHSNIVQIFDFQNRGGELFLAMQFVDGCSLEHLRQRLMGGVMPPFLAARVARDVARALDYAHACQSPDGSPLQLVHRDVSPHNVLLSRGGEVKLTDFGIAKPISKHTSGGFKGKIAYMAPEQARGQETDGRTDIFALGVVLFELVTGTRPFNSDSFVALVDMIGRGTEPVQRASTLGVDVPEELADIIARALQRDPAARYAVAGDMARALELFLRQAPSDLDLDLGRFVLERLGAPSLDPFDASALPSGAFEDTHLSDSALLPAATVLETPQPTVVTLPAVSAAPPAAPSPRVVVARTPAPVKSRTPAPPVRLPEPRPEPRRPQPESEPEPEALAFAPLISGRGKLTLALAGLGVVGLTAFLTLNSGKSSAGKGELVARPMVPVAMATTAPEKPAAPGVAAPKPASPSTAPSAAVDSGAVAAPMLQAAPAAVVDAGPHLEAVALAAHEARPAVEEVKPAMPSASPRSKVAHPAAGVAIDDPGFLKVTARPFAEVYEGRRRLCDDTPCHATLSSGLHELKFKNGDKVLTHEVRVKVGEEVCVKADFTKKPQVGIVSCAER